MQSLNSTRAWILANRDICVEALRIYLGFALFLKGINFLFGNPEIAEVLKNSTNLPFLSYFSVHIIGMAHVCGGILLAIGLITRAAAISQIPVLIGAILFVHWEKGLFSAEQTLEFTLLVLFLLLVFAIYGSGRISCDYLIDRRRRGA